MNGKIMKQEATYDWLKDEVHCLYAKKKELQERIDKAIEYIENSDDNENSYGDYDIEYHFKKELLDILKGSDKDE